MILNVPFFKNEGDGSQCLQVAMQSVLKYFLGVDFSLEKLDKLTNRKPNFWTYTPQSLPTLYELGLDLKYFSKEDLEPFLEGESFIRKHYGKNAEKILEHTDLDSLITSIKKLSKFNLFEKKIITIGELEKALLKNKIPIVLLDFNKITQNKDFYQGHYVTLTGFDSKYIYFHQSGPSNPIPNMKVKKEIFEMAFNANGTDNDCIIIYGKRN